jgi:hypothetical protein
VALADVLTVDRVAVVRGDLLVEWLWMQPLRISQNDQLVVRVSISWLPVAAT